MSARKISIVDVAKAAGVSPATVDRVLNQRGGVRSDKENLVLTAARALGIDRALDRTPLRTLRVAVLIQGPGNPFHASLRQGIDLASRMYVALNMQFFVQYIDPRRPTAIAAQIRDAHSYNGIIVTSPDDIHVRDAIASLSRHIPVVTLATDLADCGRTAYVGPDDHKAGRVAGDLMGLFLHPTGGHVMMVAGSRHITGHRDRERGFRAILNERYPSCSLATVIETGEDPEEAGRLVEIAFKTDPNLKGIYHLSAGAQAIVKSLERLGRAHDTVIITHELTTDRRRLLKERRIHAVIDQKPVLEARLAVETIAKLLGRLPGDGVSLATDIEIFLPENA